MTAFSTRIHIPVSHRKVWDILSLIEKWPEWTDSMSSVCALEAGPTCIGAVFIVKQPKLPLAKMTVVEWQPGAKFSWRSHGRMIWAVADHVVTPIGTGCILTLNLKFLGPLAAIANIVAASLVHRYLEMEAEGLRAECLKQCETAGKVIHEKLSMQEHPTAK